jgi:hypothetical protein
MLSSRVSIDKQDQKGRLDGKVVDKFGRLAFGWVCDGATWTGIAHAFDVGVHPRPVVMQMDTVECTVGIEMFTNCIGVKCDKDDVVIFFGTS